MRRFAYLKPLLYTTDTSNCATPNSGDSHLLRGIFVKFPSGSRKAMLKMLKKESV